MAAQIKYLNAPIGFAQKGGEFFHRLAYFKLSGNLDHEVGHLK